MARSQAVRITRPARLGLIALILAVLLAAGLYAWNEYAHGNAYLFGVHFPTGSGIAPGAQVFLSGVEIGSVRTVTILPDTSVDFVINVGTGTDIPKTARFSVQTTLTGSPIISIVIPQVRAAQRTPTQLAGAVWPHRVLPVSEQPTGTAPLTIERVLGQSRALGNRIIAVMTIAHPYGRRLVYHLQSARANGAGTVAQLRGTAPELFATVRSTLAQAQANAQRAQTLLLTHDRQRLAVLARAFGRTEIDMKSAASALGTLKRNPQMRQNVRAATAQMRTVTANLAGLSDDLAIIAANRQVKAELRDAGTRFREILHKI
jgi:hypothetical protein